MRSGATVWSRLIGIAGPQMVEQKVQGNQDQAAENHHITAFKPGTADWAPGPDFRIQGAAQVRGPQFERGSR